ncbi:PorP/SprF family type IX secretion system membrane protein [Luteibaculum oceani]|uniref:Type IX secretion system membrane protein PorP/SprF n=1 Tax=Luteibaculum oceani TaxID=1294296 RepID=A0A5C6UUL3_9FLAO|nr:PorP/SprF family type IX secretion system membrane protein [Luteibaculum oceani]TXC77063.1 type IX secretion system membrane protein PorP/SprF [Luteibaculum oceani]
MRAFIAISKLKYLITTTILVLCFAAHSQDVHFTQFDASPLSLNPANTGNFNGFWRFSANFRSQWRVLNYPFTSYSTGFERNMEDKGLPLSAGIYLLHDESGEAEINFNKVMTSIAINVGDEENKWSFGIQPALVNKRLNISRLTFPQQFNPSTGVHDPNADNGENLGSAITFFDLNAGIAWRKISGENVLKIGAAGFHLFQPNESLVGGTSKTPIRKVFHASYAFPISKSLTLMPKVLVHEQVKASEYLLGSYFINMLPPNAPNIQSVFLGIMSRFGVNRNLDAVLAVVGINYERWDLGFSYDINTSSLKSSTQGKGAIEFSVIYWNGKVRSTRTSIICERF